MIGGVRDGLHDVACLHALHDVPVDHGAQRPVSVVGDGLHELIRDAHAVVGVLEEDGAVGLTVEGAIVAGVDEGPGFLLFFGLAPDVFDDVGVISVEDHHLGRATGLTATLDDASEGVVAFHEGDGA